MCNSNRTCHVLQNIKNVKVRLHLASTFASNFNIVSMETLTLMQRMGTEPILLRLCFVTTVSIIFENANSDVSA